MTIILRYAIKCGLSIDSLSLSSSVDSDPPRSLEVISKSGQGKMLAMLVCTATPLLAFHSKWPSMNFACPSSESAMRCVHVWPSLEGWVSSPSFRPIGLYHKLMLKLAMRNLAGYQWFEVPAIVPTCCLTDLGIETIEFSFCFSPLRFKC